MRCFTATTFLVAVALLCSLMTLSYEDITHQRLTDQAVKVAVSKGGVPQSFYDDYRQYIIDGAGRSPAIWKDK